MDPVLVAVPLPRRDVVYLCSGTHICVRGIQIIHLPMSKAELGKPAKRRSPLSRVLLWLVLSIVIIVAGLSGYAYRAAYTALPQLDGQLKLPGLSGPVKVTRDGHGVPTIEAATVEDLFFAQGFVTAQDLADGYDAALRQR